jgi:hypothetical protein
MISTATATSGPAVPLHGRKCGIEVWPSIYWPTRTRLILKPEMLKITTWPQPGPEVGSEWYNGSLASTYTEGEGLGIIREADEAAMLLIDGSKGGQYEGLDESSQSWISWTKFEDRTIWSIQAMSKPRPKLGPRYRL